jgi:hypothetical protein
LLLVFVVGCLVSSGATALTISATNEPVIDPGTTGSANYTLSAENETVNLTGIDVYQLPFRVAAVPDNMFLNASCSTNSTNATSCPTHGSNSSVFIEVPGDADPGNYTGNVVFSFSDRPSVERLMRFSVPAVSNWSLTNQSVLQNVSVGESGRLANLTVVNRGNVRQDLNLSVTGNLSQYLNLDASVTVFADSSRDVRVGYQVPADTRFGVYTANLTVSEGNDTDVVPIRTRVVDSIRPEIPDLSVPDVDATRSQSLTVLAQDNLAVADVIAEFVRPVTRSTNTSSVVENRSVATVVFEKVENTNRWTATFTDTDHIGRHYINVTVTDSANNTVFRVPGFQVRELEDVHVLDTGFVFNDTRPGVPTRHQFLEIDEGTPVTLNLTQFSHTGENATTWIGVAPRGADVSTKFDSVGSTIELDEAGTYELVVQSDAEEQFTGRLDIQPVQQHVNLSGIDFEGTVEEKPFPRSTDLIVGQFNGSIGYSHEKISKAQWIVYKARAPKDRCEGAEQWNQCVPGFTLGEFAQTQQENERLHRKKKASDRQSLAAVMLLVVYIGLSLRKRQVGGLLSGYKRLPQEHYDEVEL